MRILLGIILVLACTSLASAASKDRWGAQPQPEPKVEAEVAKPHKTECVEVKDRDNTVYQCTLPSPIPTCKIINSVLLCTGNILEQTPSNCGYSKQSNNYVCW